MSYLYSHLYNLGFYLQKLYSFCVLLEPFYDLMVELCAGEEEQVERWTPGFFKKNHTTLATLMKNIGGLSKSHVS